MRARSCSGEGPSPSMIVGWSASVESSIQAAISGHKATPFPIRSSHKDVGDWSHTDGSRSKSGLCNWNSSLGHPLRGVLHRVSRPESSRLCSYQRWKVRRWRWPAWTDSTDSWLDQSDVVRHPVIPRLDLTDRGPAVFLIVLDIAGKWRRREVVEPHEKLHRRWVFVHEVLQEEEAGTM